MTGNAAIVGIAALLAAAPPAAATTAPVVGKWLYFAANDGRHGRELWKTDGTRAGTRLVADINPRGHSKPRSMTRVGDTLFFTATDGKHGRELWKTDGTRAGTRLVRDIRARDSRWSGPELLTAAGGRLFFRATTYPLTVGNELWTSDGTRSGTRMVKDIRPDWGSNLQAFQAYKGQLFFAADDGTHGAELWKSNGTESGTTLVKDIQPGDDEASTYPGWLTVVGNELLFRAEGVGLMRSDGTESGTQPVAAGVGVWPSEFVVLDGTLLFEGRTPDPDQNGLWRSDGTEAGTYLLREIIYCCDTPVVVGDTLYFEGGFRYIWKSDGTPEGTERVARGWRKFPTGPMGAAGGRLFFAGHKKEGIELWTSDGTAEGTELVRNINRGGDSRPRIFTNLRGRLIFVANDGLHGPELWKSNGTKAGTRLVEDIRPGGRGSSPRWRVQR